MGNKRLDGDRRRRSDGPIADDPIVRVTREVGS